MSSVAPANVSQSTHMSQPRRPNSRNMPVVGIYRPPAARLVQETAAVGNCDVAANKSGLRQRRPDLQVYVPRARRVAKDSEPPSPNEESPLPPKPSRHRSPNVVTPRKKSNKSDKPETLALADRTHSCDSDIDQLSNGSTEQLQSTEINHINSESKNEIGTLVTTDPNEKGTDDVLPEIKNSDIEIKTVVPTTSFVSPTLIISQNTESLLNKSELKPNTKLSPPIKILKKVEIKKDEQQTAGKSENKKVPQLNLNIDECSWDMMFDDNGDCLDPSIMEELTQAVGKVRVARPSGDYSAYETAREAMLSERDYPHVLEIYGFSAEFKTHDLMAILQPLAGTAGCDLKWVDDTHALAVFSNSQIAAEVLALQHPLLQARPLSQASAESKQKARRSSQFLLPYRPRPETCTALAKRMVSSALGVRLNTSREEREKERNLLREAREKKRLAAKQSEEAWEGKITSSNKKQS